MFSDSTDEINRSIEHEKRKKKNNVTAFFDTHTHIVQEKENQRGI